MTEEKKPVAYTYDERMAINTIRKSMMKKPEIITELMKDSGYRYANDVLVQARDDLAQLLEVSRAFVAAASVLAKQQKESEV